MKATFIHDAEDEHFFSVPRHRIDPLCRVSLATGFPWYIDTDSAYSDCFSKHAVPYDWTGCTPSLRQRLPPSRETRSVNSSSTLRLDAIHTRVNKFSPSSDNHMFYSPEGQVRNDDLLFMKNVTRNYNLLMSVEAFSDDPFSSQGNPIIIYPRNSLDSLEKSFIACQELDQKSGVPLYIIYKPVIEQPNGRKEVITKIYLNSDLQGAQRNHYLERAMLYYLGFPGQTYSSPDSFFFYNTQSNVDLTPIDVEGMRMMYNPGIYPGMTIEEVRRLLLND